MERLIYAPEVLAYIQTTDGQQFDISNDIIEGSLTRNVNALSALSLKVQNRYDSNGNPIYMGKIMPMDKIVVYLKKTKPILVFSGYLDLVPYYQPIPAPFTLEASCTLKRLEFTYWDPGVAVVMQKLNQLGFIYNPTTGAGWLPDRLVAGSKTQISGKTLNDTGFAALLRFLLQDVGQWKDVDVYISPLPTNWITRVAGIYKQVLEDAQQMESYVVAFVDALLNSSASADAGSSSTSDTFNGDMVAHLTSYLKGVKTPASWISDWAAAADSAGKQNNIDPRLLIAITGAEEAFGTVGTSYVLQHHNAMGLGPGMNFPSWQAMFNYAAKNLADNYIGKGLKTIDQIQTKWAPQGAANDPANLNSNWRKNVKKFYGDLGGNPETSNLGYPQSSTTSGSSSTTTATQLLASTTMPAGASGMSVQIQAGHTSPRMQGFSDQTGEAKTYSGLSEIDQNTKDKAGIEAALGKYSNISVSPTTGSTPDKTFDGDVYIQIHHDANVVGIGWPGSWSKNKLGNSFPNIYTTAEGSGGNSPPPVVRTVDTNTALSSNSKQLAYAIADSLKKAGFPMTLESNNSNLRMGNFFGYYYNNSKASIIIEMPNSSSPAVYNAVAEGIDNYRKQNRQAVYNTGVAGGIAGGISQGGANAGVSNAQALINVLVNYAKNHPETPYDSPGQRQMSLADIDPKKGVDCSGFVSDGMISIGVVPKNYSKDTSAFAADSKMIADIGKADPANLEPGTFIINPLTGQNGHIVVYLGNNKIVQSSGGKGPNIADYTSAWPGFGAYIHPKIGTTVNPVYGATNTGGSDTGAGGGSADPFNLALKSAFNVQFNFPVDIVQSTFLTGYRSFENDVKLLESVEEITKASMRVFSSLPDGGFIAWYPDYFNISGRTPWFVVSTNEIINCTIDLSDKYLATHVYLTGNPWSYPGQAELTSQQNFLELMRGAGVATIEQPYILDSFLRQPVTNTPKDRRSQSIIEGQGAVANFLSKYGVRPYNEKQLTLRHPAIEFFYAYHRFMEMWAKQFISTIELTFQPEIFPGMIVELEEKDGPGFAVYVDQVSHSFSYSSGFTTQINVMAISSLAKSGPDNTSEIHPSMALISRSATPIKYIPVKTIAKNKTKSTATKTISSRGAATKSGTTFGNPNLNQVGLLG